MNLAKVMEPSGQGPKPDSALMWPDSPASRNSEPQAAGNVFRDVKCAEMVVAAGDCDRRKRQRIARIGAECHQVFWPDPAVGNVGRGDEECARNRLPELGDGLNGGGDALSEWATRTTGFSASLTAVTTLATQSSRTGFDQASCSTRRAVDRRGLPACLPVIGPGIGVGRG